MHKQPLQCFTWNIGTLLGWVHTQSVELLIASIPLAITSHQLPRRAATMYVMNGLPRSQCFT
ncbi:hypothetical protein CDO46_20655 [Pigmentiphaga sp. NML030171]|nr:hypothetical protein CDO46_20655 [Pigmentiphaga sp. NML030171]